MVSSNSQDNPIRIIAALLRGVQTLHSEVFTPRSCRLTIQKMEKRYNREGMGFLTKTLPRLGKALDRALSSDEPLNCPFERKLKGTKLPRLLGELFVRVFTFDGRVHPTPCVACIRHLRQIFGLFYKYELPYTTDQEESVLRDFVATEDEVRCQNERLEKFSNELNASLTKCTSFGVRQTRVARRAKILLNRLFARFDTENIVPRHGPGAVSTGEKLWGKWTWSNIPNRVAQTYPIDQYFYTNQSHVCDSLQEILSLGDEEIPAKVILVPKDSRGPRLISCEPLYLQWIQQGWLRALVQHVEKHPLTRGFVNFTDQSINRRAALMGSLTGDVATLDLKEASDRISLGLLRLLFPEWLVAKLEACRSQSTLLPNGHVLPLAKFAPMGSAVCFPILALSVWAILAAAAPNANTRKGIFVYGDDVITPTAYAVDAIEQLEFFGLKVNKDKSCIKGLFRESCGCDAYLGEDVTPVRLRTVWSSSLQPDVYSSWISYANSFYDKQFYQLYDEVVRMIRTYKVPFIPNRGMGLSCPSLAGEPVSHRLPKTRSNSALQKKEYKVLVVESRKISKVIDGWKMLLRYFTEGHNSDCRDFLMQLNADRLNPDFIGPCLPNVTTQKQCGVDSEESPFTVSSYTQRKTSKLVFRWR